MAQRTQWPTCSRLLNLSCLNCFKSTFCHEGTTLSFIESSQQDFKTIEGIFNPSWDQKLDLARRSVISTVWWPVDVAGPFLRTALVSAYASLTVSTKSSIQRLLGIHNCFCALPWVNTAFADFHTLMKPLLLFLESISYPVRACVQQEVEIFSHISLWWNTDAFVAFYKCRTSLEHQAVLVNSSVTKSLWFFKDAWDRNWCGIMTRFSVMTLMCNTIGSCMINLVLFSEQLKHPEEDLLALDMGSKLWWAFSSPCTK